MAWDELFPADASDAVSNANFDPASDPSRPTPQDGARLLRAFLGIRQPTLREAVIKLAVRMSESDRPSSGAQRTA
jgi:hypothetical protein